MKTVKIAAIGAGSASFGLANLGAILRTPPLAGSELALCDIDAAGLKSIDALARRANEEWGSKFTIVSGEDRRRLLEGADFVILSVAKDREKCWSMDHEIAKRFGIMHYAENGGPGGLMHTSRNVATLLPILRDIEELCPDALVLNFTNPVPRLCILAARYTKLKMVGICHQLGFGYFMVGQVLRQELGIDAPEGFKFRWNEEGRSVHGRIEAQAEEKIDILAAGLNHFTWMLDIREKASRRDLYPLFKKAYLSGFEDFEPLTRELFADFGICPVPGDCHLVEYLPYTHDMARGSWEAYDVQMYDLENGVDRREELWRMIELGASGALPLGPLKEVRSERAELIMAAMATNAHSYEPAVNIPNEGYIKNLPEGAIVEVPAVVSASGIHGLGVGELPEPAAELCRRQIAVAELAVEAAATGSREKALQALLLDPMIDDPRVARDLLAAYLEAEREYLPQYFA
jgi:Alpha-galactosidases/6-phospho-beta-glucosidases, family 4 of glycosyl hydrolases